VLEGLRQAGVRPHRIRPALTKLQEEFGREYVLVSRALGTDGISVLWDFSRTEAGAGLIEGGTGQTVIREIVQDYLRYVGFAADDYPEHPKQVRILTSSPRKTESASRPSGPPPTFCWTTPPELYAYRAGNAPQLREGVTWLRQRRIWLGEGVTYRTGA